MKDIEERADRALPGPWVAVSDRNCESQKSP